MIPKDMPESDTREQLVERLEAMDCEDVEAIAVERGVFFDAVVEAVADIVFPRPPARQIRHGSFGDGEDFTIVTSWTVADVRSLDPDISTEDAIGVLDAALHSFDANEGINWEVLRTHMEFDKEGRS